MVDVIRARARARPARRPSESLVRALDSPLIKFRYTDATNASTFRFAPLSVRIDWRTRARPATSCLDPAAPHRRVNSQDGYTSRSELITWLRTADPEEI